MNRLVIIGNGFDLQHGLKTSYESFISWYLNHSIDSLFKSDKTHYEVDGEYWCEWRVSDELISLKIALYYYPEYEADGYPIHKEYTRYKKQADCKPWVFLSWLTDQYHGIFREERSLLLNRIIQDMGNKGWTDIESDYYELLKKNKDNIETCISLNEQLDCLKKLLCEYLKDMTADKPNEFIEKAINEQIQSNEIATGSRLHLIENIHIDFSPDNQQKTLDKLYTIKDVLLLNFNYTATADMYSGYYANAKVEVNHIHGSLDKPNQIIFGYGDEMDENFHELVELNENELLKNSKSIKYLETNNYKSLLQFLEGGVFQVVIMGHSCGNSDRTLLNTIFEHKNCVSIKPFCYINEKGEDNYSELTRNIYRNFKDKTLFRDRVVDKTLCLTLDGQKLQEHNKK